MTNTSRYSFLWNGLDGGREGLWRPRYCLGVLDIISRHEGEDVYDTNSSIYKELYAKFPDEPWFKVSSDVSRPLFRDYKNAWTTTGLASFTEQAFHLTRRGKDLLEGKITLQQAFILFFQEYAVGEGEALHRPFQIMASAFLAAGDNKLSLDQLYWVVCLNYRPDQDDLNDVLNDFGNNFETIPSSHRRRLKLALDLMVRSDLIHDDGQGNYQQVYGTILGIIANEAPSESRVTGINKIFFGPPGTGKSHSANQLIGSALCTKTQFHPDYSYGDFVGSYRPVVGAHVSEKAKDPDGQEISSPVNYFGFVPGPFMNAVADAISNSAEPHFLLIDEINRGDCSSIFGDVFQLLDRDETGSSEYGIHLRPEIERWLDQKLGNGKWSIGNKPGELRLPRNLFILGTMNTSDQNLYPMDSAFKRRWEWQSCSVESEYNVMNGLYKNNNSPTIHDGKLTWNWICLLKNLNSRITDRLNGMEDKQIGPWFIKPASADGTVNIDSFSNKLLFYLWHDVFKDEQGDDGSPFNTVNEKGDSTIRTFGQLQDLFREGGFKAIFKPEILEGCCVESIDVEPLVEDAQTSDENLPERTSTDESEEVAERQDDSNK